MWSFHCGIRPSCTPVFRGTEDHVRPPFPEGGPAGTRHVHPERKTNINNYRGARSDPKNQTGLVVSGEGAETWKRRGEDDCRHCLLAGMPLDRHQHLQRVQLRRLRNYAGFYRDRVASINRGSNSDQSDGGPLRWPNEDITHRPNETSCSLIFSFPICKTTENLF